MASCPSRPRVCTLLTFGPGPPGCQWLLFLLWQKPDDTTTSAVVATSHGSHPRQHHEYRTVTPYGADPVDTKNSPVRAARYRPRAVCYRTLPPPSPPDP